MCIIIISFSFSQVDYPIPVTSGLRKGNAMHPVRYLVVYFSQPIVMIFSFFLRSFIGGVAYVTVFNSLATWAATFRLRGYKCMLVIVVFP